MFLQREREHDVSNKIQWFTFLAAALRTVSKSKIRWQNFHGRVCMLIHLHEHRLEKLRVLKDWKHTFAGVSQLERQLARWMRDDKSNPNSFLGPPFPPTIPKMMTTNN